MAICQCGNLSVWQSVSVVCLGCLTQGACVGHWTPDYSTMEVMGSACKRRWLVCVTRLAISMTCSLCWNIPCAACLYIITRPDSQFLCTRVYILRDFPWPEVQSHSDVVHVTVPCSARVFGQARPTMSCIF